MFYKLNKEKQTKKLFGLTHSRLISFFNFILTLSQILNLREKIGKLRTKTATLDVHTLKQKSDSILPITPFLNWKQSRCIFKMYRRGKKKYK